jgi:hypothetical protein
MTVKSLTKKQFNQLVIAELELTIAVRDMYEFYTWLGDSSYNIKDECNCLVDLALDEEMEEYLKKDNSQGQYKQNLIKILKIFKRRLKKEIKNDQSTGPGASR